MFWIKTSALSVEAEAFGSRVVVQHPRKFEAKLLAALMGV